MTLRTTASGLVVILPGDDCGAVADRLVALGYGSEFCLSPSFDPAFLEDLAATGFLVMSAKMSDDSYILLPKLHLRRSVLDFRCLHASRTVRRIMDRYELRVGEDLEAVLARCVAVHGDDWLTPPLLAALRFLGASGYSGADTAPAWIGGRRCVGVVSFGLYRDGVLVAGEFGVAVGGVYTSYSGYRDEDSAGSVQLAMTGNYLRERGFRLWDLGMPMDYKTSLGAENLERSQFLRVFRAAASSSASDAAVPR